MNLAKDIFSRITMRCNINRMTKVIFCSPNLYDKGLLNSWFNPLSAKGHSADFMFGGFYFIVKEELKDDEFVVFGHHPLSGVTIDIDLFEQCDSMLQNLRNGRGIWFKNENGPVNGGFDDYQLRPSKTN